MKYTRYACWADYQKDALQRFSPGDRYVVCGVGEGFHTLLALFPDIDIEYCLDKAAASLSADSYELLPYEALEGRETGSQRFIITAGAECYSEIRRCLCGYGAKADNIISLQELFYFWGYCIHGRHISSGCNVFLLTNCNLKCRSCSQFTPYIRRHRYNSAASVQESLDLYFRTFDYVKDLILVGGETMLYRELGEICAYIHSHFQGQYHELKIFTNGLILPSSQVLDTFQQMPQVHIMISDYTRSIHEKQNTLITALRERRIRYTLNNQFGQSKEENLWFDLGDPTEEKCRTATALKRKFEQCSLVCQNLIDGKICYCVPACSAEMGQINVCDDPEMWLDLAELERLAPAERAERIGKFNLGFLDRGYLEFCKFCNGFGADINHHYVMAGEQC